MCMRPDSTDVSTMSIYWRVNSSPLDGALLLDFITQGPSYEPPFIHIWPTPTEVEKGCFPRDIRRSGYIKLVVSITLKQATNQSLKRNGLLKDKDIGRVLNMLIQRKVKASQRCGVHVHKATYSYYICTWCDVGVHYVITGLHVYTGTGTSCGSL